MSSISHFKLVLLGDSAVGKSSLVVRYLFYNYLLSNCFPTLSLINDIT